MADVRIVGKAMNDLADDWHWVVLHDTQQIEPTVYFASSVDTVCGILISSTAQRVRLYDMGAPDSPTCQACLDDGLSPDLRAQIEQVMEEAVRTPAPV